MLIIVSAFFVLIKWANANACELTTIKFNYENQRSRERSPQVSNLVWWLHFIRSQALSCYFTVLSFYSHGHFIIPEGCWTWRHHISDSRRKEQRRHTQQPSHHLTKQNLSHVLLYVKETRKRVENSHCNPFSFFVILFFKKILQSEMFLSII